MQTDVIKMTPIWAFEIRKDNSYTFLNAPVDEFYIWRHMVQGDWQDKVIIGSADTLEEAEAIVKKLEDIHNKLVLAYAEHDLNDVDWDSSDEVYNSQVGIDD